MDWNSQDQEQQALLEEILGRKKTKDPFEMYNYPYMYQNPYEFPFMGLDMASGIPMGGAYSGGESSFYPQAQTQQPQAQIQAQKSSPWGALAEAVIKGYQGYQTSPQAQTQAVFPVDEGMAGLSPTISGANQQYSGFEVPQGIEGFQGYPDMFGNWQSYIPQTQAVFPVDEGMGELMPSQGGGGGVKGALGSAIPVGLNYLLNQLFPGTPIPGAAVGAAANVLPSLLGGALPNMSQALGNVGFPGIGSGMTGPGPGLGGAIGTVAGSLLGEGLGPVGGMVGNVLGGFAQGLGLVDKPQRYSDEVVQLYGQIMDISRMRMEALRQSYPGISEQELYQKVAELGYQPQWTQQIVDGSIVESSPLMGAFSPEEYSGYLEIQWPGMSTGEYMQPFEPGTP